MSNQEPQPQTFGQFFRTKRVALGLTLRSFCQRYAYDPGNISKLERNILSPSIDETKLRGFAQALKIEEGSPDWVSFFDLANIAKGTVPQDIRDDPNSANYLPLLFRTARGQRLTKEQLEKLIEHLNQS